jgi:uncharacterized protein YndB with AHSA1/START domain
MPVVEASVDVEAPRHLVWELIADPRRHTEFGTAVSVVTNVSPGPIAAGTTYRERSGPRYMKSMSEWTVTEYSAPSRLVHEGSEPTMQSRFTWTLDAISPGRTRLSQVGEFAMMPRFRFLGRLIEALFARRMLERETERMLQDIKRIAEAGLGSG